MSSLQIQKDQAIHLDRIDRPSVRRLVEEYTDAVREASERGENIHQFALDQQDKVTLFASTLSQEDAILFWTLYGEEMTASANAMNDRTNEINAQTAQRLVQNAQNASNVATWISLIVFFVFLIFMIKMFKG